MQPLQQGAFLVPVPAEAYGQQGLTPEMMQVPEWAGQGCGGAEIPGGRKGWGRGPPAAHAPLRPA